MDNFAGVDWAKEEHAPCVLDDAGRRVLERRFAHDERGLHELCDSLVQRGVALVAIERPDGVLVERLLEAGLVVLAIHPNQAKAARPRFRAGGGKSDAFATPSCWRSWPAPTITVSALSSRTPRRPKRF